MSPEIRSPLLSPLSYGRALLFMGAQAIGRGQLCPNRAHSVSGWARLMVISKIGPVHPLSETDDADLTLTINRSDPEQTMMGRRTRGPLAHRESRTAVRALRLERPLLPAADFVRRLWAGILVD